MILTRLCWNTQRYCPQPPRQSRRITAISHRTDADNQPHLFLVSFRAIWKQRQCRRKYLASLFWFSMSDPHPSHNFSSRQCNAVCRSLWWGRWRCFGGVDWIFWCQVWTIFIEKSVFSSSIWNDSDPSPSTSYPSNVSAFISSTTFDSTKYHDSTSSICYSAKWNASTSLYASTILWWCLCSISTPS